MSCCRGSNPVRRAIEATREGSTVDERRPGGEPFTGANASLDGSRGTLPRGQETDELPRTRDVEDLRRVPEASEALQEEPAGRRQQADKVGSQDPQLQA